MSSQVTRVLVTGATGFLGANILDAFSTQKYVELIAACRNPSKLSSRFKGEVRVGDLCDANYRKEIVKDIDVICHAGTWAAMWGNKQREHRLFYEPCLDLMEQATASGVKRFLMSSSVTIAKPITDRSPIDDFAPTTYNGFWHHLNRLVDIDSYMQRNKDRGMQMINMRLGHFVGKGNRLGIVPVLLPRLKTYLVPWLSGGRARMPLISGKDMAQAYVTASLVDAEKLDKYESFNITASEFPTAREVFSYICERTGAPLPKYSVPYPLGYAFGWLMEKLFPLLPGKAPFLTRSIIHLSQDWHAPADYAQGKLGFRAQQHWREAIDEAIEQIQDEGVSWPPMMQRY